MCRKLIEVEDDSILEICWRLPGGVLGMNSCDCSGVLGFSVEAAGGPTY
jgi:hypothetical protein